MQPQLLSLLALACGGASVSAMSFAGLAYRPSYDMMAMAEATNCTLPAHFRVQDFIGTTSGAGNASAPAPALDAFNFKFEDATTGASTFCQWNASSVSSTPAGLTPRFACEDRDVKFIWEDGQRELTGIERICPDDSGKPGAEVSGSVRLFLTCSAGGLCTANSTDVEGTYYSLGPVLDPTSA